MRDFKENLNWGVQGILKCYKETRNRLEIAFLIVKIFQIIEDRVELSCMAPEGKSRTNL